MANTKITTNVIADGAITSAKLDTNITISGDITGTLATAAQPNITSLGTLTALTVDDITINGSTISDAGDLTLDSAGDINLDADGADINLKDGGTTMGRLGLENGDLNIASSQQDYDIRLKGNDGSSVITALHLDMSDAGTAIFNNNLVIPASIYHTGDTNTFFGFQSADTFTVNTAGSERMRINSAGQTLVTPLGVSTPSFAFTNDTNTGMTRPTGDTLQFVTGGSERLRIDSAGQITQTGATNTSVGFTIKATATNDYVSVLQFNDNSGTRSSVMSDHYNNALIFKHNSNVERMRIDSSGNLLVGKTANDNTTVGASIRAGESTFTANDSRALTVGRNTNDGDLLQFRKATATVGSIGSRGGAVSYIVLDPRASGAGLTATNDAILPADETGDPVNNNTDLGASSVSFKDLHLYGQILFGGNSVPFESGNTLPSSTNYDNLLTNGHYRIDNNASNAPSNTFHAVIVFGNGSNVTTQIAVSLASTTTYIRSYNNAWTSWARLDT